MPATEEELRKAYQGVRDAARLDDDSKIGHGPVHGQDSNRVVRLRQRALAAKSGKNWRRKAVSSGTPRGSHWGTDLRLLKHLAY